MDCIVLHCKSRGPKPFRTVSNKLVTLHKFPLDPDKCSDWISRIPYRKKEEIKKWTQICSLHFTDDMIAVPKPGKVVERRKLTYSAYPNINLIANPNAEQDLPAEVTSDPDPLAMPKPVDKAVKDRRRQQKTILQKMRRMATKCKAQKSELAQLRRENLAKTKAAETLGKLYASPAGRLIEHQVKNLNKKKTGLRYDETILTFSYSIFKHSPAAYKIVRSMLDLPDPSTLRKNAVLIKNSVPPSNEPEVGEDFVRMTDDETDQKEDQKETLEEWLDEDIEN